MNMNAVNGMLQVGPTRETVTRVMCVCMHGGADPPGKLVIRDIMVALAEHRSIGDGKKKLEPSNSKRLSALFIVPKC